MDVEIAVVYVRLNHTSVSHVSIAVGVILLLPLNVGDVILHTSLSVITTTCLPLYNALPKRSFKIVTHPRVDVKKR